MDTVTTARCMNITLIEPFSTMLDVGWIAMKFGSDIHGAQKKNHIFPK